MDNFLESVRKRDFDRRISEVIEMLKEKQLYGTISLINDLKYYLDLAVEERNKTIGDTVKTIKELYNFTILEEEEIDEMVRQLKLEVGGIDE